MGIAQEQCFFVFIMNTTLEDDGSLLADAIMPVPELARQLSEIEVANRPADVTVSTVELFWSILAGEAPHGLIRLLSSTGGATTDKIQPLRQLFKDSASRVPELEQHLWHLMCYVGLDQNSNVVLLNTARPMVLPASGWHSRFTSGLLTKSADSRVSAADRHVTINQRHAHSLVGGFYSLDEQLLGSYTGGMTQHSVNFLLPTSVFDSSPNARAVFDGALFRMYYGPDQYSLELIEVPLGLAGATYSIVLPLENLLSALLQLQTEVPHLEFPQNGIVTEQGIMDFTAVFRAVLSRSSIAERCAHNPHIPVMGHFPMFVDRLTRACLERNTHLDRAMTRAAVSDFVRHFFAVEHALVSRALVVEDSELPAVFERLAATEFGPLIIPCSDFAEFERKVKQERRKEQPEVRLEFTDETVKSDLYLDWIDWMGQKLRHHVRAALRNKRSNPHELIDEIKRLLARNCRSHDVRGQLESIQHTAAGFVELVLGSWKRELTRIARKIQLLASPVEASSDPTAEYWKAYWNDARERMGGEITLIDRRKIIRQAIKPNLQLLAALPYGRMLIGDGTIVESMLDEHLR
jgi:hypothetical protein